MKKQTFDKILLYALAASFVYLLVSKLFSDRYSQRVVYIDIAKLTDQYQFRKDIESEGQAKLYKIKNILDSLQVQYKISPTSKLDSQIVYVRNSFDKYYSMLNREISQKVWERLNPVLDDFGKAKGFQLIVGANGTGTVLYGDKSNDVTELAIQYVNQKYEKGR